MAHILIQHIVEDKNQTVNDGVAHSKNPRKCAYHVTFDLDLDLQQDAGLPGDHHVQVWSRSSYLPARRSDLRKSLQTDRRTDDGRLAIALAHSWNELKTNYIPRKCVRPPYTLRPKWCWICHISSMGQMQCSSRMIK